MKIVTDCAADMPAEELEKLGITQAPLFIQFPEGEVNSADITADAFYDRLEAMRPQIPTTEPSSWTAWLRCTPPGRRCCGRTPSPSTRTCGCRPRRDTRRARRW